MTPYGWCNSIGRFKAIWHYIRPLINECSIDLTPIDAYLEQITADHLPVAVADQLTPEYLEKEFSNILYCSFEWSRHGRYMWSGLCHAKIKWEAKPTYSIDLSEVT